MPIPDGLRARGLDIPLDAEARARWQAGFNALPAMRHGSAAIDLADPRVVHTGLERIEEHHRGGMGTGAINGAVIAGLFDCALGVAGVLQFPGQRAGTVDLSMKLMRPVHGPLLDIYAVAIKRADNLVFVEGDLYSGGRLCACAHGMVAVASSGHSKLFPEV